MVSVTEGGCTDSVRFRQLIYCSNPLTDQLEEEAQIINIIGTFSLVHVLHAFC